MANYINREEFLKEIIISKERDELTPKAIELLQRMVAECVKLLKYKYPEDKNDCMAESIFDVLKYWKNFDVQIPNSNVFSYYTQMVKNGLAKGWKRINPLLETELISTDDITNI